MIAGICSPLRPRPDQTTGDYGLHLIAFILDTGIDATLSDEQLALADHTIGHAVRLQYPDVRTYDRLAEVQRQIAGALRRRTRLQDASTPASPVPADAGLIARLPSWQRPDDGPMAPTLPAVRGPTPVPPTPDAIGIPLDRFPARETLEEF